MKAKPQPGEVWRIKLLNRTYWGSLTVEVVGYDKDFGWILRPVMFENTMCRPVAQVKFVEKVG